MAQIKDCLFHWKKKLERGVDEAKALDIIRKLNKVPITVQLLQETGIGKVVKLLGKQDGLVGEQGSILLKKWKEVVASAPRTDSSPNKKASSKKDNKSNAPLSNSNNHSKRRVEEEYIKEEKHLLDHASKKAKYSSDHSSTSNKYTTHKPMTSYGEYDPERNDYYEHQNMSEGYEPDVYDPCMNDTSYSSPSIEYKPTPINKIKSDSHSQNRNGIKEKHTLESSKKSEKYHNGIKNNSSTFGKIEFESDEVPRNCTKVKVSEKPHKKSLEKSHFSDSIENVPKSVSSRTSKVSPENSKVKNDKLVKVKKLKVPEAEEFTASQATFEDCLGLNDIVKVKKKKNSAKIVKTKGAAAETTSSVEKTSLKVKDDNLRTSKSSKSSSQSSKSSNSKSSSLQSSKSSSHSSKSSSHNEKLKSKSITKDSKDRHKKLPEELQVKPTPLKLDENEITFTLPEINANYRPLPRLEYDMPKKKVLSNEDAIMFTSSKKDRTAVYSGRKNYFLIEVPTLMESCIRVLIDNVTCIEQTGGVPYFLLKPVLVRCSPQMLCRLEDFNPYLLEDTDELWQQHCARDFRNHKPDEFESWREMYLRIMDEQEQKLKKLTSNIRGSMSKSNPVRKAKLAYVDSYVKPPRDVARKQAKFGTGLPVNHSVKPDTTSPKPVHRSVPVAPVNIEKTSSSSSVVQKKPKPAPLMAKTLKAIKRGFRR